MLELNKVYKWEDIVKEYPDKWVFFTDVTAAPGRELDTCRLLAVSTRDEKFRYMKQLSEQGLRYDCRRTTFSAPNVGFLC